MPRMFGEEKIMKWLKHETDAKDSEKLKDVIAEFGFEGYGWYWRIMEIVAFKMDETDRCHYEQTVSEWCLNLKVKQKKLRLFLELIQNQFNIKPVYSDKKLRIEIPNLLKKRDNYTKNLQVKPNKLPEKFPLEVEVEVEVDTKPPTPLNLKTVNPETQKLWAACLVQIKLNIMPEYFQNYFETTRVYSFEENILRIAVPNQYTRKCLIETYRELIESTLKEIWGKPILVDFCINSP